MDYELALRQEVTALRARAERAEAEAALLRQALEESVSAACAAGKTSPASASSSRTWPNTPAGNRPTSDA